MKKKYQQIQALIEAWEDFEEEKKDPTLYGFGLWLQQTQRPVQLGNNWVRENTEIPSEDQKPENLFGGIIERPLHLEAEIGRLFGLLGRIQHHHMKRIFDQLPIHSILEFGVLYSAEWSNPRRSDVIAEHLLETATGSHMISRLIRDGYLEEFPDPEDRRAKRLRTTEEGKKITHQTKEHLNALAEKFSASLNLEEKNELLSLVLKLFHHHNEEITRGKG